MQHKDNIVQVLAERLRRCRQLPEYELWKALSNYFSSTVEFIRYYPLKDFLVDIVCPNLKLAIEIEGDSHDLKFGQGEYRQAQLEKAGFKILRFSNTEIKANIEDVLERIRYALGF